MAQPPVDREELIRTLEAVEQEGSITKAAIALGIPRTTVGSRITMAKVLGIQLAKFGQTEAEMATNEANYATRRHCVIPDVQAKPGVPLDHLKWAGEYIADKKPDVIVCIGDFADMPSLSSYDKGKASAECKRYQYDVEAAHKAMELLMTPIVRDETYKPRLVLTLGNHEDRITRYGDDNPALDGHVSTKDLGYEAWGWEVVPFKKVIKVDGIAYCHFFYNHNTGKPLAGANLDTRLKTIGMSFTMGHQQGLSVAIRDLADGTRQRGLVCGSFYQHEESYRGPQANSHWQGIIMKHEVREGNYDMMEVSLNYLRKRYQ